MAMTPRSTAGLPAFRFTRDGIRKKLAAVAATDLAEIAVFS